MSFEEPAGSKGQRADQDFVAVKMKCNGMLSVPTYRKIYQAACSAPEGIFVEVGTAHGASAIALGWAVADTGKSSKVYTFDRLIGGSRARYGGIDENLKIIRGGFAQFGVSDIVEMHVGASETASAVIPDKRGIGLLMLDADGIIDRDFRLFYNQLAPGAPIIIDDCGDRVKLKALPGGIVRSDLKHKLTFELVALFEGAGLIEVYDASNETIFARKTGSGEAGNFDDIDIISAYRNIVFSEGSFAKPIFAWREWAATKLRDNYPLIYQRVLAYRAKASSG